jgi:hypothetical protein
MEIYLAAAGEIFSNIEADSAISIYTTNLSFN